MEMAGHELNGSVDLQLRLQPAVPVPPSPVLHGRFPLDSPRGYQLHRRLRSRARFYKLHLDSAFTGVWPEAGRYYYYADYYGFLRMAC